MKERFLRLVGVYALAAGGIAAYLYVTGSSLALAILGASLVGLAVVPVELRFMKDRQKATRDVVSRRPYFEIILGGVGIGLVVLGVALRSPAVALSGAPFLAIALVFMAIKYRLRQTHDR